MESHRVEHLCGASIVAGTGVYTYRRLVRRLRPPASSASGSVTAARISVPQNTTLAITAVNSAPTISSAAPTTATEGSLYTYNATRTDLDGPGQTWSLLGATLAVARSWWVRGYSPSRQPARYPASCVVAIQVCDGGTPNLCATQTTTVTITPVNDAPVINSSPDAGDGRRGLHLQRHTQ